MTHEARIARLPQQRDVAVGADNQAVLRVAHNDSVLVEHLFFEQFE
jgi:hypothetical protein